MTKPLKDEPLSSSSHHPEKASWNKPSNPSASSSESHTSSPASPSSSTLQRTKPRVYIPNFSPIHTYNLYNKIPDEIIEILHRLDQKKLTEAQRGVALSDLELKLNHVLVARNWNRKQYGAIVSEMEQQGQGASLEKSEDEKSDSGDSGARAQVDAFDDSWIELVGPLWVSWDVKMRLEVGLIFFILSDLTMLISRLLQLHQLPSLLLTPILTAHTLSVHSLLLQLYPTLVADSFPSLGQPFSRRRNALGSFFVASAVAEFTNPSFHSSTSSITSLRKVDLESTLAYLLWSIFTPEKLWESIDESDGHVERAAARKNGRGKRLDDAVEGEELGKKEKQAKKREEEEAEVQSEIEERIRGEALITVRKLIRGESRPFSPFPLVQSSDDLSISDSN